MDMFYRKLYSMPITITDGEKVMIEIKDGCLTLHVMKAATFVCPKCSKDTSGATTVFGIIYCDNCAGGMLARGPKQ